MLFRLFSLTTLVYTTLAARQTPHDRFISRAVSNSTTPTNSTSALNSTVVGSVWDGESTFGIVGHSGVGGMQISVVDDDSIIIIDKVQKNPLQINGHPAWAALYTLSTNTVKPLDLKTNSFCAGGGWLSNGTLVSVGGNPRTINKQFFDARDGLAGIRLYSPGIDAVVEEYPEIQLDEKRWYASTARLRDGSLIIVGGNKLGGFNNYALQATNSYEFFPPKFDGKAIASQFLKDALNTNLFPVIFTLPNGQLFVAANKLAMIFDWRSGVETRLPNIPMGLRVNYPSSAAAVLLPLTIANRWTPSVLLCGGSDAPVDGNPLLPLRFTKLSSQWPASDVCLRMLLDMSGKEKWEIETMSSPRIMGDAILTPDGKVLIINGAKTGVAGYANVKDPIGQSNADNANLRPSLYDPLAPAGSRITHNFPSSTIERLYHSSATLTPDGSVFITGSSPNADVVTKKRYATRYEVEIYSPPYMTRGRPTYTGLPSNILYQQAFNLTVTFPPSTKRITAVIMDLGCSTHGVHMNMRSVELTVKLRRNQLSLVGPRNSGIYPPGYAWLYILADGIPSKGKRVMIGDGASPPTLR